METKTQSQQKPASEIEPGEEIKPEGFRKFVLPVSIRRGYTAGIVEFILPLQTISIEETKIVTFRRPAPKTVEFVCLVCGCVSVSEIGSENCARCGSKKLAPFTPSMK
jgi:hypothetical protein